MMMMVMMMLHMVAETPLRLKKSIKVETEAQGLFGQRGPRER